MIKFIRKSNNLQEVLPEVQESLGWREEINFKEVLKTILQKSLDFEFTQVRGCEKYGRLTDKRYYANGHYQYYLKSNYGDLFLQKPRFRGAPFESKVLKNYQKHQKQINFAILKSYLLGTSLRDTTQVTSLFTGIGVSHQTIANWLKELDVEIFKFHHRKIREKFKYLYLDGLAIKAKEAGKVRQYMVLLALGITVTGERRLLDFNIARSEKEENWTRFLNHLYSRGLDFEKIELIISDRHKGILGSLINYYPMIPHQVCVFHKIANLNKYLNSRKNREGILNDASKCYQEAISKEDFVRKIKDFETKWREKERRAVRCFLKDYEKSLTYFDFPKEDWHLLTTNNQLERYIEELRKRLKTTRYFQNLKSAERLVGLLILNKEGLLNVDMLP